MHHFCQSDTRTVCGKAQIQLDKMKGFTSKYDSRDVQENQCPRRGARNILATHFMNFMIFFYQVMNFMIGCNVEVTAEVDTMTIIHLKQYKVKA